MTTGKRDKFILAAILVLGAFARLRRFGAVPCGLNQDEAFAAYEAWALLHSGVDSSLHAWPVYLTAWGSGMNALETYLLLPLLALFGVHTWVIRLPQVLLSLLSLFCAYRLGRRIGGERAVSGGARHAGGRSRAGKSRGEAGGGTAGAQAELGAGLRDHGAGQQRRENAGKVCDVPGQVLFGDLTGRHECRRVQAVAVRVCSENVRRTADADARLALQQLARSTERGRKLCWHRGLPCMSRV